MPPSPTSTPSPPSITNDALVRKVKPAIEALFPIVSRDGRTEVRASAVHIDPSNFDIRGLNKHQHAREYGETLGVDVRADIELYRDGKRVQRQSNLKLGLLPLMTDLNTFMVGGNDYFVPMAQARLKSGIYTREMENGLYESFIRIEGPAFKVWMDPAKGIFKLGVGSTNVSLISILLALGASDDSIVKAMGGDARARELLNRNKVKSPHVDLNRLYQAIFERKQHRDLLRGGVLIAPEDAKTPQEKAGVLREWFSTKKLDTFVTKHTLGTGIEHMGVEALLSTLRRILAVQRGDEAPDDRDAPEYKKAMGVEDLMVERIAKVGRALQNKVRQRMTKPDMTLGKLFGATWIDPATSGYFGGGGGFSAGLSGTAEAANPLAILSEYSKVTVKGEGGIQEDRAITDSARLFRPTGVGFYDPVHTPEGSQIGISVHTASNVRRRDGTLEAPFFEVKNGRVQRDKPVWVSIETATDSTVGYPEYWDKEGKPTQDKVRANKDGQIQMVPASSVQYIIPSGASMFDHTTNSAGFSAHTHPNRAMMAGKHLTQALPLVNRETPLADLKTEAGSDVLGEMARMFVVRSRASGTVTEVTKKHIKVGDDKHELYDEYPMQAKVSLTHHPVVKVGDKVTKGQLLADSNYSRDGRMALGVNLRSAYMPFRNAANYEDAIVISETAAKKLSSEHMHREYLNMEPGLIVDRKLFIAQYPTALPQDNYHKLDESGVIKKGQKVSPGEVLVAAVRKREFEAMDRSGSNLSRIHKILLRPYSNAALTWDESFQGEVYRVVRTPKKIEVHVKTVEPLQVGDKLSMASAAKGTVSEVVPDDQMPRNKDGKVVEVVLNPFGIAGRINPSQTIEQAAGKLVRDGGVPLKYVNFDGVNYAEVIQKKLKEKGLSHAERLYDPSLGKWYEGPVATGYNYLVKLDHPVRKKFSARGRDGYTMDETPTVGQGRSGQSYDQLTTYALLGHNAHAILGESVGIRGTKNDDFWAAYQAGETPPPPKVPFIFEKFRTYLNAAGVDTEQRGNLLHYMPMTEKRVRELSNGAIERPLQVRSKDLAEERGGLFDPKVTGGVYGKNWSHIELNRRMPHPLYAKIIKDLTGVKMSDYYGLIGGTRFYNKSEDRFYDAPGEGRATMAEGFEALLDFDPKERLRQYRERLKTAVGSDRNRYHRATKYLRGLIEMKLSPKEAYLTGVMPVVPPNFRPVTEMRDGGLRVNDSNVLYRDLMLARNVLDDAEKSQDLPTSDLAKARLGLYDAYAAVIGVGKPLTDRKDQELQGFFQVIKGKQNKHGLFQRSVARRRNDYTGRSTIEPDANLGVDEIGLPEDMAWKIYQPIVVRRLSQAGWSPAEALQEVEKRTLVTRQILEDEMKQRPVIYSRAPAIHRWNAVAARPFITPGKELKISPIAVGPQNMDFDGNCCIGKTLLTLMVSHDAEARKELDAMRTVGQTRIIFEDNTHTLLTLPIEAVPRGAYRGKDRNGADVYEVPAGISVLTSDTDGAGPRYSPATLLTVEEGCRVVEVMTRRGFSVSVSDNESLAVYDPLTRSLVKRRPEEAVGELVPYVSRFPVAEGLDEDAEAGWLIGAFCGDGFFMGGSRRLGFTKLSADLRRYFEALMKKHVGHSKTGTFHGEAGGTKLAASSKDHYYNPRGFDVFEGCYVSLDESPFTEDDRAALRKRLPPMYWSRKLALGVLAGLIDTDGSISCVQAKAKKKPQYQASITTSSPTLRDGILHVARILGVRCSFSTTNPSAKRLQKHPSFLVSLSMPDLRRLTDLPLQTEKYRTTLREAAAGAMLDTRDVVPVPAEVWDCVRDKQLWSDASLLASLRTTKNKHPIPTIARASAERILQELAPLGGAPWYRDWQALVHDVDTRWDRVATVEERPGETVYDLVVPETKVFAVNDGLIIYDTAAVHVPITEEARREAYDLLPSKNLFYDRDRSLAYGLEKDVVAGIFALTKPGRLSGRTYKTPQEAVDAFRNNKDGLRMDSLVRIDHQPLPKAVGWLIFEQIVPSRFLKGVPPPIDGKKLKGILAHIAKDAPAEYNLLARRVAQAGFQAANLKGNISSTVDELVIDRTKIVRLLDMLEKEIDKGKTEDEKREIAARVYEEKVKPGLTKEVVDHVERIGMGYGAMIESRATGKLKREDPDPLRQMLASPTLVKDIRDRVVPSVVRTSYGSGMNPSDYILTTPGARAGMVSKSLETALPGALAKEISGNLGPLRVTEKDCNTEKGIEIDLSEPDPDILDRHLLRMVPGLGQKNDPITPELLAKARDRKMKSLWVRSSMTCETQGGVCQQCVGRNASGNLHPIGANIGLNYGQAVSERSTQLTLRVFHAGGTVGAGDSLSQGFSRVRELLAAPSIIRDQGVLSDAKGRVKEIKVAPQGGHFVIVQDAANKEHEHYTPANRKVIVKVGDQVDLGDKLTDGHYRPQEIAEKKGPLHAQQYVVSEMRSAYAGAGETIRKPVLEVVAAGMMRHVEIVDDGGEDDLVMGDVLHENDAAARAKKNPKIKYRPTVLGLSKKPLATSRDLMERLNFQRLEDSIREVPAMHGVSDLEGQKSPIPGLAYGAVFRPGKVAEREDILEALTLFDEW